jgi:hypothetical protein
MRHWKTQTFIAALRRDALIAPFVIDAPMDRRIFETYVETQLAPTLDEATSSCAVAIPLLRSGWGRSTTSAALTGLRKTHGLARG